ncbi:MAG: Archaellum biogenesis ATPase ArlH/FlaH [Candidatus Alkanophagales archaeon MCA70_species_2]|nr:Archaellum biogenesis ATPase ArlH/FlaH [Candidatus Alkanophaga liquidiphilum]
MTMGMEGFDEEELEDVYKNKKVLSTGNSEIDKKMGGGIPVGSLTLIEGPNDSGKSVLSQQIMWGGLQQGFTMAYYTTENTVKSLIKQMESLSLDISDYFILGRIKIFPIHLKGIELSFPLLEYLLKSMKVLEEEVTIIDSLTVFLTTLEHAESSESDIINFFASCKSLCDEGKTILITAHEYAFSEELLVRIRSICDGHIRLRIEEVGTQLMKTMEVAKMRGADRTTGNIISFDVEPGFGLRIIPISRAKA